MRISDWSSDVCSSDLKGDIGDGGRKHFKTERAGHHHHAPIAEQRPIIGEQRGFFRLMLLRRAAQTAHRDYEQQQGEAGGVNQEGVCRSHPRSEEHTSELQSLMRISYAVFCLKKKKQL